MIDTAQNKHIGSIPNLPGVAGVLVSNERDLIFTSNRGEKTIGIFQHHLEERLEKVKVGGYPNGLSFNPSKGQLLAANVSKQDDPNPVTVSMVDVARKTMTADISVPGRTRWTIYDKNTDRFYVNISQPAQIIAIDSSDPDGVAANYMIPAIGPHGLDIDHDNHRLFCACDEGGLFTLDLKTGKPSHVADLRGSPDVIFYNERLNHLYVAVGDPGVLEVFDTRKLKRLETVKTQFGAHTFAYNAVNDRVYVFLPETHNASVYQDG